MHLLAQANGHLYCLAECNTEDLSKCWSIAKDPITDPMLTSFGLAQNYRLQVWVSDYILLMGTFHLCKSKTTISVAGCLCSGEVHTDDWRSSALTHAWEQHIMPIHGKLVGKTSSDGITQGYPHIAPLHLDLPRGPCATPTYLDRSLWHKPLQAFFSSLENGPLGNWEQITLTSPDKDIRPRA